MSVKYVFSGHESFPCKSLWLKKGYDFVSMGNNFNDAGAVMELGVGKNMVASVRFWLKAFGLTKEDQITAIADYIFDTTSGVDPYVEDLGTLWLLHYLLVSSGEATLYNWLFTLIQKERKQFDRATIVNYIKRKMIDAGRIKTYNENTSKKDIGVLLQNYVTPSRAHSFEDYSSLLIDLDLILLNEDGKTYEFNLEGKRNVTPEVFLYAIIKQKGKEMTVPYDTLQEIGLMFCMTDMEIIDTIHELVDHYANYINYSDVAGIRQIQFIHELDPKVVLDKYYSHGNI